MEENRKVLSIDLHILNNVDDLKGKKIIENIDKIQMFGKLCH